MSKKRAGTRLRQAVRFAAVLAAVLTGGCGDAEPPYSPEAALQTFQLAPGFRIELAAAEPQVVDPVSMAFDERGRLFVVEMRDYPISDKPLSRIKLLEDRDGDGRFEHSSVFVDGLHMAHGVLPWKGGILVTCAPDILHFTDTDDDGRADQRKVILTGFAQVNPQLRINTPLYEMDNWIYAAYPRFGVGRRFKQFSDQGQPIHFPDHPEIAPVDVFERRSDIRFKPDKLQLEPVSGNSEFGHTFNARGHRFPSWNNNHLRHSVIETRYLDRNPHLQVDNPMQTVSDHGQPAPVYPITDDPHLQDIRQTRLLKELGHFTSACGQSIYAGGRFPQRYHGAYFIAEPAHNLVHSDILSAQGATYTGAGAFGESEFLASRDSWFMPVFTTTGPDGALYVVDFHRKIVEHPEWIREDFVDDQELFYAGQDHGRIYRIVHGETEPEQPPRLDQAGAAELADRLSHPNRWWRLTAQRLLVESQDQSVVPRLKELARSGASARGRMHALWTLEGLDALDAGLVLGGLSDESPEVREQAIRMGESYLSDRRIVDQMMEMTGDPDERVRFQLACTLGELPANIAFKPLVEIAADHMEDPWFQVAVLSAAADDPVRWFRAMIRNEEFTSGGTEGRQLFLRRLTSMIGARQKARELTAVLAAVLNAAGDADLWWPALSLEGLAEGLKRGTESEVNLPRRAQQILLEFLSKPNRLGTAALEVVDGVRLSDTLQFRSLMRQAAALAADEGAGLDARVHAIRLAALAPSRTDYSLLAGLLQPRQPEEIQMAATRALIVLPHPKSTEILLDAWRSFTASLQNVALDGILREPRRVPSLLDAVEAGTVQPWTIRGARRGRLFRVSEGETLERARTLLRSSPPDLRALTDQYGVAARTTGDIATGREVFNKNCSQCHKVGETGSEVGPDLLSLSGRTKYEFLENILDPNSNIVPGYEEYLVQTHDGRALTGVMASQGPATVTLRRSEGEEDTIARSQIANLRSLGVSAMPEGVQEDISVRQMTDLLEYLTHLGADTAAGSGDF